MAETFSDFHFNCFCFSCSCFIAFDYNVLNYSCYLSNHYKFISQALLVEHNPYRKDVLEFGEELEAERLLQILNSDEMQNRIIEEFNLFEHYDIKPEDKHAKTWMNLEFDDHFSFKRTELMSIEIEVLDENPEFAAAMSNAW